MAMSWLHRVSVRRLSASFLVLFFFSSQAFSCCLFNQRMGDYLKSTLASVFPQTPASTAHSCCPKKQEAPSNHEDQGTGTKGCCIQDANAKLPQIASDGLIAPTFPPWVVERLARAESSRPVRTLALTLPSQAAPPLYLAHLQLLI